MSPWAVRRGWGGAEQQSCTWLRTTDLNLSLYMANVLKLYWNLIQTSNYRYESIITKDILLKIKWTKNIWDHLHIQIIAVHLYHVFLLASELKRKGGRG